MIYRFSLAAVIVVTSVGLCPAQEWSRFRGPNGTGVSDAASVPAEWTDRDLNWKVTLPGIGHSSPVLWGDKIFLTSAFEDTATRLVLCLRAGDGQILWQRKYSSALHTKHKFNSFASSTPCLDAEAVYCCWSTPEEYTLLAIDHEGNETWRTNLGPYVSQHSCGVSPVVYGDLVILGNDQGDEQHQGTSSLLAVDRRTGDLRWKLDRRTATVAYSTPCVYQPDNGKPELIFNSESHGVTSVDPGSGVVNWEMGVFSKRSVSSPVVAGGLIFGSCGSGGGGNYLVAVRPPAGPGSSPEIAYKVETSAPYVPTPVALGDLIFLWSDNGIVTCLRAATGDTVWQKRVGGNYHGSPVCVGGKLYCIREDGEVTVVAAADEFKLLGRNPLGEESRSTPAVADGRMYLRSYSRLVSVGGR
ncbi:MAG TPA: PQQ-binding-like beta-propeller repeat protein [Pirellulales bacterium]|jgi:outer membrane protein assembly factor BamB|nr:PQQ-binding-like beta-propeller repeat protein [Pirellulales bacterium]HEV3338952.1 PQQ-binding-like beta-propeller repeat protein [Pirellulales bacterium]